MDHVYIYTHLETQILEHLHIGAFLLNTFTLLIPISPLTINPPMITSEIFFFLSPHHSASPSSNPKPFFKIIQYIYKISHPFKHQSNYFYPQLLRKTSIPIPSSPFPATQNHHQFYI